MTERNLCHCVQFSNYRDLDDSDSMKGGAQEGNAGALRSCRGQRCRQVYRWDSEIKKGASVESDRHVPQMAKEKPRGINRYCSKTA